MRVISGIILAVLLLVGLVPPTSSAAGSENPTPSIRAASAPASGAGVYERARLGVAPAPTATPSTIYVGERVRIATRLGGPARRPVKVQVRSSGQWADDGATSTTRSGLVSVFLRPLATTEVRLVAPSVRSGKRRWPMVTTSSVTVTVREAGPQDPEVDRGEFTLEALTSLAIGESATFRVGLPPSVARGEVAIQSWSPAVGVWGYVAFVGFDADDVVVDVKTSASALQAFGPVAFRVVTVGADGYADVIGEQETLFVAATHGGLGSPWGAALLSSHGSVLTATLDDTALPEDPFEVPTFTVYSMVFPQSRGALPTFLGAGYLIDVSENSRYVLFASLDEPLASACGNPELMLLDRTNGSVTRASSLSPDRGAWCPVPSMAGVADDGAVAFYTFRVDSPDPYAHEYGVFVHHPGEPYAAQLEGYSGGPHLSGDGRLVAVSRVDAEQRAHWTVESLVTGEPVAALDDVLPGAGDSWVSVFGLSHDGSTAVVMRSVSPVRQEVYLWEVHTGRLVLVTDDPRDGVRAPILSGDGRSVAYRRDNRWYVWRRSGQGGTETRLSFPDPGGFCAQFSVEDLGYDGDVAAYRADWSSHWEDCSLFPNMSEDLVMRVGSG